MNDTHSAPAQIDGAAEAVDGNVAEPSSAAPKRAKPSARERMAQAMPVLQTLAGLYPHLFGTTFRPLKRGIFQDLMQAHPETLEAQSLKEALAVHTRSTRYLQTMASGQARRDLAGKSVEPLAPEHVHHALVEVYRRRTAKGDQEQARAQLLQRLLRTFEASGLSPQEYRERVHSRDANANALTEAMLEDARAAAAKVEALARAYQSSGLSVQAFADSYGMTAAEVMRTLVTTRPSAR